MRRVVALVAVLLLAAGVWMFRDPLVDMWDERRGGTEQEEVPSEAMALDAERKLESLRDGTATTASFSAVELESLLLHRYRGVLPSFLDSPQVEFSEDRMRLRARVPIDKLPRVDGIGQAAAFLPDTTELAVDGKLLPLGAGRVAFGVDGVSAARFPLPDGFISSALSKLGRVDEAGLPRDAIAVPLPPGAESAYIRRDSLVLLARSPARGSGN